MLNKLPGSMQYLWSKVSMWFTNLISVNLKRYFWHPEKSILNVSLP